MATYDTVKQALLVYYYHNESIEVNSDRGEVSVKIAVVFMLSIFSVVGVIGNAIAFYIFFGRRSMSTSVFFILTLAGTDFFTCLVTIPYTIVFEILDYNLVYDMACKTYMFLITSTVPFSAYIMVGIALDRYFCICHPFLYVFTVPRVKAVVFCMGIPAVIFGLITALSHGTYVYKSDVLSNTFNNISEHHTLLGKFEKSDIDIFMSPKNLTNVTVQVSIIPYGQCVNNTFIFSREFLEVYKNIHALNFLFAYLSVAVLYILIYRSIFTRRVNKAKRRKSNLYPTSSSKAKCSQRDESQMTTSAHMHSPKALNNHTRKDGKGVRKITLTARNDPSIFGKPDAPRRSCTSPGISEMQNDDMTHILARNNDHCNRDVNGYASPDFVNRNTPLSESKSSSGREYHDKDNDCSVYTGPHTCIDDSSGYIGPQTIKQSKSIGGETEMSNAATSFCNGLHTCDDESGVYIGPQSSTKNKLVYTGQHTRKDVLNAYKDLHKCEDESGVYIGPQSYKESESIFISPQTSKDPSIYDGPYSHGEDRGVYIGPKVSKENSVYTGPHECLNMPIKFQFKGKHDKRKDKVIKGSDNNVNRSDKELDLLDNTNCQEKSNDRNINNEDTNTPVCFADGISPEEKPLLPRQPQFLKPPQGGVHPNSTSRGFSKTAETRLAGDDTELHGTAEKLTLHSQTNSITKKRAYTLRDRHLMANIKTAFMLFIVTLVFLIAFLPALLMANDLVPLRLIVFYSYFIYNVVNPFIYAFMNQTFREDLTKLMKVCQG